MNRDFQNSHSHLENTNVSQQPSKSTEGVKARSSKRDRNTKHWDNFIQTIRDDKLSAVHITPEHKPNELLERTTTSSDLVIAFAPGGIVVDTLVSDLIN
jgi:hypothetical protein